VTRAITPLLRNPNGHGCDHGTPPSHRPSRHPAPYHPAREQAGADFFEDGDYELYLDLLADAAGRFGVEVWSYCLMPNHVHIIAVPVDEDALSRTFRYVHRHYTGYINA
jgi:Transposase IS200 like